MSALEGPLINLSTSAFWDLKLDEESTMLATLATSYERYRWLRLLFVSTFRVKYFRNIIKNYMIFPVLSVMVSIIKFSIVIGSPLAYLSRNQRAISWVSNYTVWVPIWTRIWTFCNWIPTWFTRQFTRTLMAFFAMLRTIFYIYEKHYRCFRSKELPKRHL